MKQLSTFSPESLLPPAQSRDQVSTVGVLGPGGRLSPGSGGSHLCLHQHDRWLSASDGEDDQRFPSTSFILSPLVLTRRWPAPRLKSLRSAGRHVL